MSLESKYQRLYYNDFYNADLGFDLESILMTLSQNEISIEDVIQTPEVENNGEEDVYYLDFDELDYSYFYYLDEEREADKNSLIRIYKKYLEEIENEEDNY